ncbi:MAG: primosomal protein N' [Planctomycetota bacterium]|nr:MAG: primosomal protein N' [Planctomycetota bacterium]HAQ68098.1 primosomal protein N' [Phycisphaerales bacterium]
MRSLLRDEHCMSLFASGDRTVSLLAQVAVERSLERYPDGLTYALPPELADVRAGERVRVPLGRGDSAVEGIVVRTMAADAMPGVPISKLKFVEARSSAAPPMPMQLVELAQWISAYYVCPIGMTLASMTPAAVKKGVGTVTRTLVDLAPGWEVAIAAAKRVTVQQRRAVEALRTAQDIERPMDVRDLCERAELGTPEPVKRLVSAGILVAQRRTKVEAEWRAERAASGVAPQLTAAQNGVVESIGATIGQGFSQHLLFGVTGAGKTEVYMRLIERTLAAGRTALVLVPEIGLTPQTGGRLMARFPQERVAILHSGLTSAQRNQHWNLVSAGQVRLVMGARSAVFAPVADGQLGLIVVDEEHDASYKQDQMPRYHGRDVAIRRAQMAQCPIVLGSATPSLESWFNATERKTSALHVLRDRAPGLRLPHVEVVDFAEERKKFPDRRVHLLGPRLAGAIQETLDSNGQVLILLNRRGYGNWIACADHRCGWLMRCERCDAGMICHTLPSAAGGTATQYVRCHHCQGEQKLPRTCPVCGKQVSVFGLGVQRVEEELARLHPVLVPGTTMLRIDADSMQDANDFHDALGRFGAGEVRLLVGTQMIAKGLDFPGVRLVGVVNADTALNLPDFRAAERTFQLVSQVSGRCGRSAEAGRAIVQTFQPDSPAIKLAAAHDYEAFASEELALRERFALPPWRRMARVVIRDGDEEKARVMAEELARALAIEAERMNAGEGAGAGAGPGAGGVEVVGPMPCPIARISDRWRMQVEITAPNAASLGRFLTAARNAKILRPGETYAVDVDPVALM